MKADERQRMVSQAAEVLRHRVDTLGVAEPVIQPAGENHIMIQLPGLSQAAQDEARKNIQKAAYLEFRLVHPDSDKLLKEGMIPPGYKVLTMKRKNNDGTTSLDFLSGAEETGQRPDGKIRQARLPQPRPEWARRRLISNSTAPARRNSPRSRATTSASSWPLCWTASFTPRPSSKA